MMSFTADLRAAQRRVANVVRQILLSSRVVTAAKAG